MSDETPREGWLQKRPPAALDEIRADPELRAILEAMHELPVAEGDEEEVVAPEAGVLASDGNNAASAKAVAAVPRRPGSTLVDEAKVDLRVGAVEGEPFQALPPARGGAPTRVGKQTPAEVRRRGGGRLVMGALAVVVGALAGLLVLAKPPSQHAMTGVAAAGDGGARRVAVRLEAEAAAEVPGAEAETSPPTDHGDEPTGETTVEAPPPHATPTESATPSASATPMASAAPTESATPAPKPRPTSGRPPLPDLDDM